MAKKKKGKGGSLGGLADALVKSGVASEKAARQSRRERANEDRELGRDGVEERERERKQAEQAEREAQRERDREQAAQQREASTGDEVLQTIQRHAETARGSKRWFFVARDGRIPFLEVADTAMRMLGDGHAGIVESLGAFAQEHVLVSGRQALERLEQADPEIVRFWNRQGRER